MALTELQLPSKEHFYSNIQTIATNMKRLMAEWTDMAEFLENVGIADLDAMGVPLGDVRTDLVNFRIIVNEMVAFFEGTSTSQSVVPEAVVNKTRRMR